MCGSAWLASIREARDIEVKYWRWPWRRSGRSPQPRNSSTCVLQVWCGSSALCLARARQGIASSSLWCIASVCDCSWGGGCLPVGFYCYMFLFSGAGFCMCAHCMVAVRSWHMGNHRWQRAGHEHGQIRVVRIELMTFRVWGERHSH